MKNYKEYPIQSIGGSDIASLIVRGGCEAPQAINFAGDDAYSAYIVDENAEIGDHYKKVYECTCWISIYDDTGLKFHRYAKEIKIYRAGDFGAIVQLIGEQSY